MSCGSVPITIKQGADFTKTLLYHSGEEVVKAISAITRGFPTVFTCTAHGLATGARPALIIGCLDGLNAASLLHSDDQIVTKIDANTFSLRVDSTNFDAYTSGGHLAYIPPVDMSEATGRMQVRNDVTSETVLAELTTENEGLTLGATGEITMFIANADTALLDFPTAVYDVEVVLAGVVQRVVDASKVSLSLETTR